MIRLNNIFGQLRRDVSPIGIDIGHESIKMLQLARRGAGWQVSASGMHVFGDDVRRSPELRWRYAVGAIDSLLNSQPFKGRRAVAVLDPDQVQIKNTRLPRMPERELAEAIRWEAADRFPFDVNNGILHFVAAGDVRQGGEQRQEVLMFAAADNAVREQLRLLEQAGCQPVGMDATPVALARAAEHFWPVGPDADDPVRVIADLGGNNCLVVITRGDRIVFVKAIEIGSADLTRAVAEKVGTSHEDTFGLRLRMGGCSEVGWQRSEDESVGEGSKIHRAVTAAMRPVIERLAHEISLCLRYYSVTFRGHRPDSVTFVGGASHDQLLMQLLSEALGAPAIVGNPLSCCLADEKTCEWGMGPDAGGPEWAAAMGACLKPPRGDSDQEQRPAVDQSADAGDVPVTSAAIQADTEQMSEAPSIH
jgi:type IV pilus assembly protein PilM